MSEIKRFLRKFVYAFQGIGHGLKYDRSIRVQFICAAIAIIVSLLLDFTIEEIAIVLVFCALVISLEFINSTVERIMDLEQPEINKSVKHIKDMAAGGVLVASIFALIVGLMFVFRHI